VALWFALVGLIFVSFDVDSMVLESFRNGSVSTSERRFFFFVDVIARVAGVSVGGLPFLIGDLGEMLTARRGANFLRVR